MNRAMSTIVVKLYKPSTSKKNIMDKAMLNYSRAFQYLLNKAKEDIDNIEGKCSEYRGKYKINYISKWVKGDLDKDLNTFNIEPFKDSIKLDFAATLSEYFEKKGQDSTINYPLVYKSEQELEQEFENIIKEADIETSSNGLMLKEFEKHSAKEEKLRPIYFCRYAKNRNYSLLYDPLQNKYFAKLYLMNGKDRERKRPETLNKSALTYISEDKEVLKPLSPKRSFLLFPISFGKWQLSYLEEAIENPSIVKTARLFKKKGEYFLSISFSRERPETMKIENYLGISKGIENIINYSIVDIEGSILDSTREKNFEDIHKTAKKIFKIALENKCQVIMENRFTGVAKSNMNYKEYNQLLEILSYRLPDGGLPPLIKVSGRDALITCPNCGKDSKENIFEGNMMMCTSCGTTMDMDQAGSINIARKLIKYHKDTIKVMVENVEGGIRFKNKLLDLDFISTNPYDCIDEFKAVIKNIIKDFYDNIVEEAMRPNFMIKASLIKKVEANPNVFKLINEK